MAFHFSFFTCIFSDFMIPGEETLDLDLVRRWPVTTTSCLSRSVITYTALSRHCQIQDHTLDLDTLKMASCSTLLSCKDLLLSSVCTGLFSSLISASSHLRASNTIVTMQKLHSFKMAYSHSLVKLALSSLLASWLICFFLFPHPSTFSHTAQPLL